MKISIYWLVGAAFFAGCSKSTSNNGDPSLPPPTQHQITDPRLTELSGIAASVLHPGILYTHNDSGDSSRFFALDTSGEVEATIHYNADPHGGPLGVRDVEDIAVGIGPDPPAAYVYLGDIGDNSGNRSFVVIYRVKEPALPAPGGWISASADALFLHYPDGPRDAETLMVDPADRLLYIVSKREDSVGVYTTPLDFTPNDTVLLTKRTKLFIEGAGIAKYVTAGDISQAGDRILLRDYAQVFYWRRDPGVAAWKTMQSPPVIPFYILEPQGEAIGFSPDGKKYYTTSEGLDPLLRCYTTPD